LGRARRILFVVPHRPGRSPGQRFRFEQYLPALREAGFECLVSPAISAADDQVLYRKGHLLRKALILVRCLRRRSQDLRTAALSDVVFVYREALPVASTHFERRLARTGPSVVFDFDDAIWLMDVSEGNRALRFLKAPEKTATLLGLCDRVFAGNEYLAAYARRFATDVAVVPTTIDTDLYEPRASRPGPGPVVIGWSGSPTTSRYLEHALPVFQRLKERYGERVAFRVVGDEGFSRPELGLQGVPWTLDRELELLRSFDIGIMPMPDEPWALGKCGLKGLQYMALEIPTVMTPLGVNTEIVQHGRNGFLAREPGEWVSLLSQLVESEAMRRRLGAAGRATVVSRYSLRSQRDAYVRHFVELADPERRKAPGH
jgi:glycosyltransferase involved in cell wall biosynthesis